MPATGTAWHCTRLQLAHSTHRLRLVPGINLRESSSRQPADTSPLRRAAACRRRRQGKGPIRAPRSRAPITQPPARGAGRCRANFSGQSTAANALRLSLAAAEHPAAMAPKPPPRLSVPEVGRGGCDRRPAGFPCDCPHRLPAALLVVPDHALRSLQRRFSYIRSCWPPPPPPAVASFSWRSPCAPCTHLWASLQPGALRGGPAVWRPCGGARGLGARLHHIAPVRVICAAGGAGR